MTPDINSHNTIHNRRQITESVVVKRLFITLAILGTAFLALVGSRFFTNEKYGLLSSLTGNSSQTQADPTTVIPTPTQPVPDATPTTPSPSTGSSSAAASSRGGTVAPSANPTSAPSSTCGASIPEGACTAITSIESKGAKNNPYVSVDTSQLPEGTMFAIDRSSWSSVGTDHATANATATFSGQVYRLTLTFTFADNTWKVTSYAQS